MIVGQAEQRLWVAVIDKAISDLHLRKISDSRGGPDRNQKHRESAWDFLFSEMPAYKKWRKQVFQMAGLAPTLDLSIIKPKKRGFRD